MVHLYMLYVWMFDPSRIHIQEGKDRPKPMGSLSSVYHGGHLLLCGTPFQVMRVFVCKPHEYYGQKYIGLITKPHVYYWAVSQRGRVSNVNPIVIRCFQCESYSYKIR